MLNRTLKLIVLAYATRIYKNRGTGLCSLSTDPILRAYFWYSRLCIEYHMFTDRLSYANEYPYDTTRS